MQWAKVDMSSEADATSWKLQYDGKDPAAAVEGTMLYSAGQAWMPATSEAHTIAACTSGQTPTKLGFIGKRQAAGAW